jgi:predicted enzyme related to lactoylglutathione lyase
MIQSIAFIVYPVSDLEVARRFYEESLGLSLTYEFAGEWFEYEVAGTTFAITLADAEHPVPVQGAALAFEVSDLESEVERLKKSGVKFQREISETPVCRFAVILDPDGSQVIIHKRNPQPSIIRDGSSGFRVKVRR